jgi:hypothetical protein
MGFMELLAVAAGLVVLALGGWIVLPRLLRTSKAKQPAAARPVDTREFTTTSGGRTAFGRLSTIR